MNHLHEPNNTLTEGFYRGHNGTNFRKGGNDVIKIGIVNFSPFERSVNEIKTHKNVDSNFDGLILLTMNEVLQRNFKKLELCIMLSNFVL